MRQTMLLTNVTTPGSLMSKLEDKSMKKILSTLLATAFIPFSAFAISLSDITNNPEQYVKIKNSMNTTLYVDISSIESLRYDPPYYTLRGKAYAVNYSSNRIFETTDIINYDYTKSVDSVTDNIINEDQKLNLNQSKEQMLVKLEGVLRADCGMNYFHVNMNTWDFNGDLITSGAKSTHAKPVQYEHGEWMIAEKFFEQYYNQEF